ncbi:MAG: hypothetical protein HRU38_16150 [Saccharospirillaceae bacterium]|nr:hypothetical protein [Pseudomonadales bacterium]NRB80175.1 hypothetical protein [Saccharospirillaceae bacterium]
MTKNEIFDNYDNDEVAKLTKWNSLSSTESNVATHKLVKRSKRHYCFEGQSHLQKIAYLLIVLAIGMGVIWPLYQYFINDWPIRLLFTYFPALLCLIPAKILFKMFSNPVHFDINNGCYWVGSYPRQKYKTKLALCQLKDIHAIQFFSTQKISMSQNINSANLYNNYEVNLVLKNGMRANVLAHGGKQLLSEAVELSKFLNVRLWTN